MEDYDDEEEDIQQINVLVFGDKNVGKSEFLERFDPSGENTYRSKTGQVTQQIILYTQFGIIKIIAVEVQSFNYEEGKFNIKKEVVANKTDGIILLFDITSQRTFKNLKNYLDFLKTYNDKIPIIIVGNKADQKNIFQIKQQVEIEKHGLFPFYDIIATANYNIIKPFIHITRTHMKLKNIMLLQEIPLKSHQQLLSVKELLDFGDISKNETKNAQINFGKTSKKVITEENFI